METKTARSKRIRIRVTQEDIDKAGVGTMACPIALAGRRKFNDPELTVGAFSMWRRNGNEPLTEYPLSKRAREFVRAFDSGGLVEPFEFRVTERI